MMHFPRLDAAPSPPTRRTLLRGAGLAAACAATPWALRPAAAQGDYPDKPLKLIVPYPPGGNTDVVGRIFSTPLAEALGQPVVVDNRGGAAAVIGATAAARSAPDGYNLFIGDLGSLCINRVARPDLPYDPVRDFTPVSLLATVSVLVAGRNDLPAANFRDVLAMARAQPGKLRCGTSGAGSIGHLVLEMVKHMAGVDIVHVPYRGGAAAVTDVLGGHIDFMIDGAAFTQAKAGKLKALAATGDRVPALPQVPTIAESGIPGFHFTNFWGYLMPTGAPTAAVQRLSGELQRIAKLPAVRQQLESAGLAAAGSSPQAFGQEIRVAYDKVVQIVSSAKIEFNG
ncbi:Bug family tripartite tricarboxylate transporter substrate binding protein [Pseudorhodoferax sp.]|uniref:Bug family tripartite tricarboxylate transporter substrate binding protein n=1 Tax=Pseudorhodoferax sp. TaxID=1993553 RepID=UPI0039E6BC24